MTASSGAVKLISWNIARRQECWRGLLDMGADLALLQEATEPPPDIAERIEFNPEPWRMAGDDTDRLRAWRAAVVKLSGRVEVDWIEAKSIA